MTSSEQMRCWLLAHTVGESLLPSAEGRDVDAQLDRLRQYATEQGWEIAGETRDPEMSGGGRHELDLVSLIEITYSHPRPFDILLMEPCSRVSKVVAPIFAVPRCNSSAGTEVCMISTSLLDVYLKLVDTFTFIGSPRIAMDRRLCRLRRAQAGHWVDAAPFGYIGVRQASGGRTLAIREIEAEVVRHAFGLVRDHKEGPTGTARRLNDGGFRTRRGSRWSASAVRRMVRNPAYVGRARVRIPADYEYMVESGTAGIRVSVPRIVTRQLFFSVQRILRDRSTGRIHINRPKSCARKRGK